jgi:hypothetical protein
MTGSFKSLALLGLVAMMFAVSAFAAQKKYLVTNDDNATANTATVYTIGAGGALTQVKVVKTGGTGNGGGYFASPRVGVLHDKVQSCVYISDAGSADVAAISEATLKLVGKFKAGASDAGTFAGVGLIANQNYLYAGFSGTAGEQGTGSIATYKIKSGCKLKYLKSIPAKGLGAGTFGIGAPDGMGLHGKILVVAYGDGSIESFNVSHGVPVPNHDEQNSTGEPNSYYPAGVDISADGKFAIFGDIPVSASYTTIEVSNISTGKLTKTKLYGGSSASLGTGVNSNDVELSPDESLIYVNNNGYTNGTGGGTVTAVFFNKTTGKVSKGCISPVLQGYGTEWFSGSGIALANNASGTGSQVYIAETAFSGTASWIGVVDVSSTVKTCSLKESTDSFVLDGQTGNLESIASWPPRAF